MKTTGVLAVLGGVCLAVVLLAAAGCAGAKAARAAGETSPEARARIRQGNARLDAGDLEAALVDFTEAIRLDPRSAQAYNNRGLTHYRRGDLDGAAADYTAALRIDPAMAEAYYNRGVVRLRQNAPDAAIADFGNAVAINPNHAAAFAGRAMALAAKREFRRAVPDFEKALQLAPPDWPQRKDVEAELKKARDAAGGEKSGAPKG
jgi:tetratricopeptide (TPR) repeat protein